jgi:hypothetical protein
MLGTLSNSFMTATRMDAFSYGRGPARAVLFPESEAGDAAARLRAALRRALRRLLG